ncbi:MULTISPECIES: non-ribosomal peptide synthetase [unclassified Streptomyces]|uniref:non-ribosomal peptide synthetase n=1 Tax=unclassified Streptomyces TaxID=2593676 RepID=UPI0029ABC963|nr:non-ribosomal peptide synthetase [Streptomyces sp. PA03-2a]MDX2733439.1 non-ribosomal peptide synthetase [Streptomyces sp. PA03-2a]
MADVYERSVGDGELLHHHASIGEELVLVSPKVEQEDERRASTGLDPAGVRAGVCVLQLIEERVRASPDAVAVADRDGAMTYAELDDAANQLAGVLVERGAVAEGVVAVNLPRGRELVMAVLAVLKSGAAYLPLDPALPAERRAYQLEAAGVALQIGRDAGDGVESVDPAAAERPGRTAQNPRVAAAPGSLAYVIFTSGSTGRPKPVAVTHASLGNHAAAISAAFELTDADRVLQFASPGFDVFGEEVFPTLLAGARVVVVPDPAPSPAELEEHLRRERVTVANLPTPYWDQWVRDLDAEPREVPDALRLLVVGSDTGHTRTLAGWRRHTSVPVFNAYGLTETTITATLQAFTGLSLPEGDTLPIGRPLAGARAYVLDAELGPVPAGTPGELYLGGLVLARGYLGQPGPTADRFVPDPFGGTPGGRLYRTGDLVVLRADGALAFVGRVDDQVKIRGQRVEPAEISAALCTHPAVRQAHVRAVDDEADGKRLVAYVVAVEVELSQLRGHLAMSLPAAMIPTSYVLLDELPLTANGKIDHRTLPLPAHDSALSVVPQAVALTGLEEQIAAVWREVLRVGQVGLDDSFFEIGGHSLLLVQVQRKLAGVLGRQIPGVALFAHPTIRKLAAHLREGERSEPAADERADERRSGSARLQQRRARQNVGGAR